MNLKFTYFEVNFFTLSLISNEEKKTDNYTIIVIESIHNFLCFSLFFINL